MSKHLSLPLRDGYRLRSLEPADVTDHYMAWFNRPYVKQGLNISARPFTLFDHLRHIEQCKAEGFLLLTFADAQNFGINSYLKMRFEPQC